MSKEYEHNTAHQLRPVKAFDIASYMDFTAPIASGLVSDAKPGTVMHRIVNAAEVLALQARFGSTSVSNANIGNMVTGLSKAGMPMFLLSKQDSEDVINNPVVNGQLTSISANGYGGYNTAIYTGADNVGQNIGSNLAALDWSGSASWNSSNNKPAVAFHTPTSAYTVFPAACGLELADSEFAAVTKGGTAVSYEIDMPLTSPGALTAAEVTNAANTSAGTAAQQAQGGFLKPGTLYSDNICGIVSRTPAYNENRIKMIRFWAVYMPAMNASTVASSVAADTSAVAALSPAIGTYLVDTTKPKALTADTTSGAVTYAATSDPATPET